MLRRGSRCCGVHVRSLVHKPVDNVVESDYIKVMTKTATAIGYVRVSTVGQATEGVSLDAQRAKLEAWAELNGSELAAVHVDAGVSGGRADNRPALQAAIDEACKAKAALVVYSLSRLARSTRDAIEIAERLDKAGADLVSLSERIDTTSAAGRMIFRMLAVLAEFERDQISERTATAMQHKRTNGEYTGGKVPYGWQLAADGANLEPNEAEQTIRAAAVELRAAGLSLRKVGASLEAEGLLPRSGGRWYAKTVSTLLSARAA